MAGVNITPALIGGAFTRMMAYFPSLVVVSQDGGRIIQSGYTGSGSDINVNYFSTDDGSSSGLTGNWISMALSQDQKIDQWAPQYHEFALGSCELNVGTEGSFFEDAGSPPPSPAPIQFVAYYDNAFNAGESGPEENFVRYSADWGVIENQPLTGVGDLGSVKAYPANQVTFDQPFPAISSFQAVMGYANATSIPGASENVIYEAAWDIYGVAHTARQGTSLEVMFWTYNNHQDQDIGFLVETGIDLNGDGLLWDLYTTPAVVTDGGVAAAYSYGIFYLQEQFQNPQDAIWVNILAGLRYFCAYYVIPSGPGAPANALDCGLYQITRGWEVCSTDYTATEFRLHDYRLILE